MCSLILTPFLIWPSHNTQQDTLAGFSLPSADLLGACTPHSTPAPPPPPPGVASGANAAGQASCESLVAAMDANQLAELLLVLQQQQQMQAAGQPAAASADTNNLLDAEQVIDAEIQQLLALKHERQQCRNSHLLGLLGDSLLPALGTPPQDMLEAPR